MEKVTIHRALAELKVIGSRIEKGIADLNLSGLVQKDKLVNSIHKKEDFENQAKSKFQSVIDLIDRRNKIKSTIVQANGTTKVEIAGKSMTIADAINLKSVIVYKKSLIEAMKKKHQNVKAQLEKNNAKVDDDALKIATVALSKQGVKIGDDDAQKVIGPFLENNRYAVVDPIEVDKKVDELETELSKFETEVDATLSEVNAITVIEF